jgi:hypothetical protein
VADPFLIQVIYSTCPVPPAIPCDSIQLVYFCHLPPDELATAPIKAECVQGHDTDKVSTGLQILFVWPSPEAVRCHYGFWTFHVPMYHLSPPEHLVRTGKKRNNLNTWSNAVVHYPVYWQHDLPRGGTRTCLIGPQGKCILQKGTLLQRGRTRGFYHILLAVVW